MLSRIEWTFLSRTSSVYSRIPQELKNIGQLSAPFSSSAERLGWVKQMGGRKGAKHIIKQWNDYKGSLTLKPYTGTINTKYDTTEFKYTIKVPSVNVIVLNN